MISPLRVVRICYFGAQTSLEEKSFTAACDGLMNCPFSWVNAFYYIKLGHRALNPAFQAYIEFTTAVMEPIIKSQGLAFVAWAFTNGHVKREGQTEIWNPEELVRAPFLPSFPSLFQDRLSLPALKSLLSGLIATNTRLFWNGQGRKCHKQAFILTWRKPPSYGQNQKTRYGRPRQSGWASHLQYCASVKCHYANPMFHMWRKSASSRFAKWLFSL